MSISDQQQQEIEELRSKQYSTRRATVPALEEVLYTPIPVLDHGFVRVIDYLGDDEAIVQAARVSYGKGTNRKNDDRGLIRYLVRHRHTSPLEMCEIKLHVKLPMFVARQWIRHRTAKVNEYSARYSILDREFYLPSVEHLGVQSTINKQGRAMTVSPDRAAYILKTLKEDATRCYDNYQDFLNEREDGTQIDPEKEGLSRELARMNLPVNFYTQWYWKIDLHNLLHFIALRMDSHAQYEIRVYAEAIAKIVEKWVPYVWEAFADFRFEGTTLSRQELEVIRLLLKGEKPDLKAHGLSLREQNEFKVKFGL